MFKRQSNLQQTQPRRSDNSPVASCVVTSLSSPGSWDDDVNTVAATVGSQSSFGRLSAPDDGDPPITSTDDWTVVEAGSGSNLQDPLSTVPDTATPEQLQVTQAPPSDYLPEAKDKQLKRGGEVHHVDGALSSQSSNPVEWSDLVADNPAQLRGGVTLSPV
jgi:hypothetical protein